MQNNKGIIANKPFSDECSLCGTDLALEKALRPYSFAAEIYRRLAILAISGISVSDILLNMGINEINVYGYGELGKLFVDSVKTKIND